MTHVLVAAVKNISSVAVDNYVIVMAKVVIASAAKLSMS